MRLYAYWRSSASWRVRIGLHHKGLPFEYVAVHLRHGEQIAGPHLARNPMGQVPVLELDDGTQLAQSLAILEYLEEVHPEPALLPAAPVARARVRQAAEIVNAGTQPLQNLSVLQGVAALGGDRKAWAKDSIARGLAALERLVEQVGGEFVVGDTMTLADACMVPQLYNARRFEVDTTAFPRLVAIDARCAQLSPFVRAHPDAQPDAGS